MDPVSHALIGSAIGSARERRQFWLAGVFGALPDLAMVPVYFYLGALNNRPLWVAWPEDWMGIREAHPFLAATWEVPHSLFFWSLLAAGLWLLKRPMIFAWAYVSHIIVDVFTHTGEWASRPLYPFDWLIEGFTDAWAWPVHWYLFSWIALLPFVIFLRRRLSQA